MFNLRTSMKLVDEFLLINSQQTPPFSCSENFHTDCNGQKYPNVLCTGMFSLGVSEIKTNQKGIIYLCAQVQLCVLGHYLQTPFVKFTSVSVPSLGLRLIIHTS